MRHAMIHKGLALLLTFGLAATAQAVDNLRFKGNLVEQACTIRPGDEAITLELWDLTSKHLYINTHKVGNKKEELEVVAQLKSYNLITVTE